MSELGITAPGRPKSKTRSVIPYRTSFYQNMALMLGWYALYRAEKRFFKMMHMMNSIIDLCVNDPASRVRLDDELVRAFKKYYYGPLDDGEPAFFDLNPVSVNRAKGYVVIGKPVPIITAWAGHDLTYLAYAIGYSYPMEDGTLKPYDLKGDEYTNTVSFSYWFKRLKTLMHEMEPLCARIELQLADALLQQGIEMLTPEEVELVGGEEEHGEPHTA